MTAQLINDFQFAQAPHIHFGWGIRANLAAHLRTHFAGKLVIVTSKTLAKEGNFAAECIAELSDSHRLKIFEVSGEPSPELVDEIVQQCDPDSTAVIGIGGGSVLDAAKAIAGLIPSQHSVMNYLEGVGKGDVFNVATTPFIAVPTTAGTGSETTKNAVLSRIGHFKKSFRDNKLLAQEAWLDPELLVTCPKDILYATGMDAFTQLLESYTTYRANPMTDALAWQGMSLFKGAFEKIDSDNEAEQKAGYSQLMLAASFSGMTLANAGLGAVHGLAGPIGAFFHAPHGIVCARLLSPITAANIAAMENSDDIQQKIALQKYQKVAVLLNDGKEFADSTQSLQFLVSYLATLAAKYAPDGLNQYGLSKDNIQPVLDNCRSGSMLGNPIELTDEALILALTQAIS